MSDDKKWYEVSVYSHARLFGTYLIGSQSSAESARLFAIDKACEDGATGFLRATSWRLNEKRVSAGRLASR